MCFSCTRISHEWRKCSRFRRLNEFLGQKCSCSSSSFFSQILCLLNLFFIQFIMAFLKRMQLKRIQLRPFPPKCSLYSNCRMSPRGPMAERSGRRRHLFQDKDRSGNDPPMGLGLYTHILRCSRNSRNGSGKAPRFADSEHVCQA